MKKGFTLIELMIVVAIIAIIAAIAIPNLLESKKAANESNAGTSLKAYNTAQQTYLANNYSGNANNSAVYNAYPNPNKCYAITWQALGGSNAALVHQDGAGTALELINVPFGDAMDASTAYNGYFYDDVTNGVAAGEKNLKFDHGLIAIPAQYATTGTNTFIIDGKGVVYMKDNAAGNGIDGAGGTDWPAAADLNGAAATWATW